MSEDRRQQPYVFAVTAEAMHWIKLLGRQAPHCTFLLSSVPGGQAIRIRPATPRERGQR